MAPYVSLTRPSPRSTLVPYTTLFRSDKQRALLLHALQLWHPAPARPRRHGRLANRPQLGRRRPEPQVRGKTAQGLGGVRDRKSTRLNSSHLVISYAVFCLKKKK